VGRNYTLHVTPYTKPQMQKMPFSGVYFAASSGAG
jgi:hypothetical protein